MIGATLAALTGITAESGVINSLVNTAPNLKEQASSSNNINSKIKNVDNTLTIQQVAEAVKNTGAITPEEYNTAMKYYNAQYENDAVSAFLKQTGYVTSDLFSDILPFGTNSEKTKNTIIKVNSAIEKYLDNLPGVTKADGKTIYNNLLSTGTTSVPSPKMYKTIDPTADMIDVDDPYWWRGRDMAELYNLDYDIDTYYDLIRKGTEAAVAARDYENQLAEYAAQQSNASDFSNYLNALSDSKANAVINGSTLGARMANELLQNASVAQDYSNRQSQVAQNSINNIDRAIRNNADARVTATDYFSNNVAQPVIGNIEGLYFNDVNRVGGQLNYNANVYAANQDYNSEIIKANAANAAAYNVAKAQAAANDKLNNEYAKLWYAFYTNNKTNKGMNEQAAITNAYNTLDQWLLNN